MPCAAGRTFYAADSHRMERSDGLEDRERLYSRNSAEMMFLA